MLRETLEDIGRSSLAKIYTSIVLAMEAGEGPNTQDKALRVMVVSDRLFEDGWLPFIHLVFLAALLRQRNMCTWCSPWRPVRVRTLKTILGVSSRTRGPPVC